MPEKHEFDVRSLRRGSQSYELEQHNLPPDTHSSPQSSVLPPPYCVQDEYPPCDPGHISTTDNPANEKIATATNIHDPELCPHFSEWEEDCNIVNLTHRPGKQPPDNKIGARENRRQFRSEIWEAPKKSPKLRTIQTFTPRRFISRTFPADFSTQPYLDQCYDRPYGFSPRNPLPEGHENTKSVQDLCLELEYLQKQVAYLKSAIIPAEQELHSLAARLPRNGNDGSPFDILTMAEKERMISRRMQWLQKQLVIMRQEIATKERAHEYAVEELNRVSELNDRLTQPLKDVARAMNERSLGRRWLQGELPWANAVHIGNDVPNLAMIMTQRELR
ncbi:uncharacterized protein EAF01_007432 [Botrytis porri]|uniref:Uncharacterized protein n=1 Tax=Botrytis porri TaxID=87229 RepID=A0A4Z1KDF8_9HELO|nr:uncharacterized protein EAF01_007432 [Botrytis porri]KAF7902134.1 hypothetical protein EAF01_007432 [Botrytis porri]TGO83416.1 hypothetical protein BPOR_0652g00070 [Botrytis porri]